MARGNILNVYPLSSMQEGMLVHSLLHDHSEAYFEQIVFDIEGNLDIPKLEQALNALIARYDILRTVFIHQKIKKPRQVVLKERTSRVYWEDLSQFEASRKETLLDQYVQQDRQKGFNLSKDVLIRLTVVKMSETSFKLIWSHHHIIMDGWSIPTILSDFFTIYRQLKRDQPIRLDPVYPYSTFIQWLGNQNQEEAQKKWQEYILGYEPVSLIPETKDNQRYQQAEHNFVVDKEITSGLKEIAKRAQVTLNSVFQSIWGILLQKHTNVDDVVFGSVVSGRPSEIDHIEKMVGLFINTIPVRIQSQENQSFLSLVQEVQSESLSLEKYQHTSLTDIQPQAANLLNHIISFQNFPLGNAFLNTLNKFGLGFSITNLSSFEQTNFDLNVMVVPSEVLTVKYIYNASVIEEAFLVRISQHLQQIMEQVLASPDMMIRDIEMITKAEREKLLVEWNRTEVPVTTDRLVPERVAAIAAKMPEQKAVVSADHSITYGELERRANQVAHYLRKQGVGPETLVGLCAERSVEMFTGMLGIMKAGAAYVPMDPAYPSERLAFIIEDGAMPVVLTQAHLLDRLSPEKHTCICLDRDWEQIARQSEQAPEIEIRPDQLAYVIYTSGSTGTPKGVEVEHCSLLNLIAWHQRTYEVTATTRATQIAGTAFDASVWETWPYLTQGATLYLPEEEIRLAPDKLQNWLLASKIEISFLPTPLAESILTLKWPSDTPLRYLLTGGDQLHHYPAKEIPFTLVNHYGPTENTVVTTAGVVPVAAGQGETPSIGQPIDNVQVYVLNGQMKPVPVGVPGELYIGGSSVARGYWNRPDLTAAHFVPHPFSEDSGARLYKTGDLVRYSPEGELQFLGRIDQQVKIRGFRIELGEIEAALYEFSGVKEAVVVDRKDASGEKRLAAYVVLEQSYKMEVDQLREHLAARLPEYMVPAAFVAMESLPLTPNGKVDRKGLPEPRFDQTGEYTAPRTPTEEVVASIYTQVLSVEQVGIYDHFFHLGGHSLLATQAISRLQEAFGVDIPLRMLFENPIVEDLSKKVTSFLQEESGVKVGPIDLIDRDQPLSLSYAQQRLWFFDQLLPDSALYNIPSAMQIEGELDVQAWEKSLQAIIARHESLRTTFSEVAGEGIQVIHPQLDWSLNVVDLQYLPEVEREKEVQRLVEEDARTPFDLAQGPLMRASLIQVAKHSYVFLLNLHHIVSDGWSMGIFMDELADFYEAFRVGESSTLPELSVQYADFAAWQRKWLEEGNLERQLTYWREKLQDSEPLLPLPTDFPRPAEQRYEGALYTTTFPKELLEKLQELSRKEESTLFMTLLAAFQVMLYRYTGKEDVMVGTPVAGRNRREVEKLIGFFVNTLVMRGDLSGEPTFREFLSRVRETALEAYAHQDVPFEKLVDELELERSLSYSPLFQVMFALQNTPSVERKMAGLELFPYKNGTDQMMTKFDLTLTMEESSQGLVAMFEYNTALFERSTIERMVGHFNNLLEAIVAEPDQLVDRLPLLSSEEQAAVLTQWNQTEMAITSDRCVPDRVSEIARKMPDQLAVVSPNEAITYGQLEQRANQIANFLLKKGVSAETLVGLYTDRSVEMLVGMLGIVKAGAAYVPMDPAYPQDRLAYMMQDAAMPVVLTQAHLLENISTEMQTRFICLDRDWKQIEMERDQSHQVEIKAEQLAYVIYTSGSTGMPKGVEVEHGALLNLVEWHQRTYDVTAKTRATQIAGTAFDASVWEIWPYLTQGATLFLPEEEIRLEPEKLRDWLVETGITISFLPTPLAESILKLKWPTDGSLCYLLTGGDKLHHNPSKEIPFTLVNHYGPTENTVVATAGIVPAEPEIGMAPSIGQPIDNVQVYVLDQHLQPVPIGVPGELYLGGNSLARGYWNRSDLTAEAFVLNPFSNKAGDRLYKTGDLVRYLSDGNIDFIGRIDHQVIIRGFRIELGEIETVLLGYTAVQEAVMMVREDSKGTKRLVAYLVLEEGQEVETSDLRLYLKEKLPEYMIPAAFVFMDRLPLTPNGKVDRRSLPEPEYNLNREEGYVAPQTEIEATLAEIWKEVLGVEEVGIHDNYFELGGDSILSIQIVARANQHGFGINPKRMFDYQTISELAATIVVEDSGDKELAEQGEVSGELPLTPIQQWFFEQDPVHVDHWNQSVLLKLNQSLDTSILEEAFRAILNHHDGLRLRFRQVDGGWEQYNEKLKDPVPLGVKDLTTLSKEEQEHQMVALADEAQASLNLSEGPLLQAVYFKLGAEQNDTLFIAIHHLVVDGVSWRIILDDLQNVYRQLQRGEHVKLPAKTTSFKQWALRLREFAEEAPFDPYWAALQQESLPVLMPDDPEGSNIEADVCKITLSLDREETDALLQKVPIPYRTQINEVLLSALAKVFYDWTGQTSLYISMEAHGRENIIEELDLSRTVGWFTSMFPMLLSMEQSASWSTILKSIKEQVRYISEKGIHYGIARYLRKDASIPDHPQPQISFNYLGQFDQGHATDSLYKLVPNWSSSNVKRDEKRGHLIDIVGSINDEQLQVTWLFSKAMFKPERVEEVARNYMKALREMIAHCLTEEAGGYTLSDFPLATLSQRNIDEHLGSKRNIVNVYPLTPMQEGMLFHTLYEQGGGDYIFQLEMKLLDRLDIEAFEQAWQKVVDHHEILRTSFIWQGVENPHQIVHGTRKIRIESFDWRHLPISQFEEKLKEYRSVDRERNFDISEAPLMRWALFQRSDGMYHFVWTAHHVLLDGWSIPLVLRDWQQAYQSICAGKEISLNKALPFSRYIAWLQRQNLQEAEAFWRQQLQGFDTPTPLGMGKVGIVSQEGKSYASCSISLPVEVTARLEAFVRRNKLTLNTLVLGAWALILGRYSDEEEVLFGATASGRPADLPGVESMVGLFINTLPLRVSLEAGLNVRNWLHTLQQTQIHTRQYEYTPLVDIHGWSEISPETPLFESILVFENYPVDEAVKEADPSVPIAGIEAVEQTNYPLTVVAAPGKQLMLRIQYEENRFTAEEMERLLRKMNLLLDGMMAQPEIQLSDVSLLEERERRQLLVEWNRTEVPVATDRLVPERVAAIAANMPEQQAIVSADHSITYGELDRRANQVAHYLLTQGVGPETLVGLCTDRSVEMFIGMLGIMKAGAAYVPMDPAYPAERLAFMMQDGAMPVVLTQAHLLDKLATEKHTCICLDRDWEQIDVESEKAPQVEVRPDQLAYVIYTSGSTGTPKGVEVEHRSLLNLISWHQRTYEVTAATRATQIAGTAFDASVWETWPYLTQGATLYLPEEEVRLAPEKLRDWLLASEITISFLPTPLAESILTLEWPAGTPLRYLLTGGDQLHHYPAKEIPFTLVNHYGPTENTVVTTAGVVPVAAGQGEPPSIGRPIDNVQVYVLDGQMKPVPMGVPGELYIGGSSVARGYWNRPDLTATHFVPHPFSEEPGARLYKTGDLVRYSLEGELQFLGRIDQQVKIRGFRIELGEIEAALYAFSGVKEAVVVERIDPAGEKRLVAYVVLEQEMEVDHLRTHLATSLPEYMVPAAFVTMESLPLTPNGKVDRKVLPEPQYEKGIGGKYVAPQTPTEEIVANIYTQILSVEQVGVHDNFFHLGGHSLLATQAISRLQRAFGVSIPLRLLFEFPTVKELSRRIADLLQEEAGAEMGPIVSIDRDQPISLSYAQQRLWFLDKLIPNSALYNIPITMRIEGELDVQAWEKSLQAIIARHESLRTTFSEVDGEGIQVILPQLEWQLDVVDLQSLEKAQQEAEVQRLVEEDANRPFDLTEGPLMRASLIQVAKQGYVFLLNLHHIVADGWSMGVLMDELAACYDAFRRGETPALPELSIQYADYASWQRQWLEEGNLEKQLHYWQEKLQESEPLLPLPIDFPRPAEQRYEGALYTTTFSKELLEKLQDLSREEGATLFMTLLSGFQAMLARYTGKEDILVGTPVAGRNRHEAEELIGFFVNTLVMRGDLSGESTFREFLGRIRETALEAYAHQDVPFEKLVDELKLERSLSYSPLFQVMFVLQNTPPIERKLADLQVLPYENGSDEMLTKFDLTVTMMETEEGLAATFEYNTHLFKRSTIERMVTHFHQLLEGIVQDPDRPVSQLPLLPKEEHVQLVEEWNQTAVTYPREKTVAELFMEIAAQWPERTAVVMGESSLTYRELDRRTNQLAHYLRKAGVGPETLVGICAERSLELITGMIGILKAGGAYVPLDPDYPQERLAYMMEDAEVSLLLTQEHLAGRLPTGKRTVLCLDQDWEQIATEREEAPEQWATADHLAYVIYTSGSTGTPKGVCTPHRGIVRLVTKPNYVTISEEDVFLQGSTVSFDAATFEIWGSLLNGAKLVMMPPHLPSLEEWREAIQEHGVTTLWLTAGLFTLLVDHQVEALKGVRQLLVGGDVVSLPHVRKAMAAIDGLQIINGYGPTETTTFACCYPVTALPETLSSLPIGRPIQNTTVYVLDAQMQPVPIGVPGELYIGGDGVARGYLNNPELTATHFVPDPFSQEQGARLYKTGDQVRWLADGTIEFLGRIDHQVKVRGFRIELGEIETALHQHEAVKEALVIVREDNPGDKRLAAYLVVEDGEIEVAELRSHLKAKLPEYMMPSAFVMLKSFPLTPNGKVDRRALPVPEYIQVGEEGYVAPETFIETTLAQIWKEVLGMDEVGIHDNFFELGGDSILSIQIVARANQAGIHLTPKQLFDHQTIAELSSIVDQKMVKKAEQGILTGEVPFLPIQKWFFEQEQPSPHHWNQSMLFTVRRSLTPSLLEKAIHRVVAHHDALRLRFMKESEGWKQVYGSVNEPIPFSVEDLSSDSPGEQVKKIESIADKAQASLDLTEGPLMRVIYFHLGSSQEDRLLIVIHHLIVDGVSWRILLEDLERAYEQEETAGKIQLPPKTTSYQQWALKCEKYANSEGIATEKEYWLQFCEEIQAREILSFDQSLNTEENSCTLQVALDEEETTELLQTIPSKYRVQINDVLLAGLAIAYSKWNDGQPLYLHMEGHGREGLFDEVDLSRTVGWFTSMYPVLLDLKGETVPTEVLRIVKERLDSIPNKGVNYGFLRYLSQDVEIVTSLTSLPEPSISFNYLGQFHQMENVDSLFGFAPESSGRNMSPDTKRAHALDVVAAVETGQLHITWVFNERFDHKSDIEELAQEFLTALRSIIHYRPAKETYRAEDFQDADLSQAALNKVLSRLKHRKGK